MILPEVSAHAAAVDNLAKFLFATGAFFSVGIFALMIYFCIRYRRHSDFERGDGPTNNTPLEIFWASVPFAIMLVMFFWGGHIYMNVYKRQNFTENVTVVGKQWMWKFYYANGKKDINELHLLADKTTQITLVAQDVIHSFYVPGLRLKQDAVPGRYLKIFVHPTRPGTYKILCAEYCGTDHSRMRANLIVDTAEDYQKWLNSRVGLAPELGVAKGRKLFEKYQCASCHQQDSTQIAPSLKGLYGGQVPLQDGRTVKADDMYLRTSIMFPFRDRHKGYPDVMPAFRNQLSEEDILSLIAYIKSLGSEAHP